ncbi:MAG: hypothetical protein JWQ17_2077 [Tardiphaga sp.]|nr:hypothetical protein [Tardiphaga sp.]
MRLLAMPTSQDWHVVMIGGFLAIRHRRRTAKSRKMAIGIIADRAPLGAKPQAGPPRAGAASARNYRRSHPGAVTDLYAARRNHCLRRNVRIALTGHRHFRWPPGRGPNAASRTGQPRSASMACKKKREGSLVMAPAIGTSCLTSSGTRVKIFKPKIRAYLRSRATATSRLQSYGLN